MTINEYLELSKKIDARHARQRSDFPETVCQCGHESDCHSSCYHIPIPSWVQPVGVLLEFDDGADCLIQYHRCMKCECDGFWR